MRAWARAVGLLLFGLALAELVVRGVLLLPIVREKLDYRYGPVSDQLSWYYTKQTHGESTRFRLHERLGWVEHVTPHEVGVADATFSPLGPRQPAPPALERTPGKLRVLLLGDSFTLGDDVPDAEAWGARLMVHAPHVETVNLGVGSYDIGQMLLRYEEEGRAWKPDVVLLGVNELIAGRSVRWFSAWQRPVIAGETGDFTPRGLPIPEREAMARQILLQPRLWDVMLMARHAALGLDYEVAWGQVRTVAVTGRLAEVIRADGARPIVVTLAPTYVLERFEDPLLAPDPPLWPTDGSVEVIDVVPALKQLGAEGAPLRQGTHWSPVVHDRVAQLVAAPLPPPL